MEEMKDRIKSIMDDSGMSQQQFAEKLSVSPASLSSIFTGRTNPTKNHVEAIHREFPNINVSWLMFGEGAKLLSASDASEELSGESYDLKESKVISEERQLFDNTHTEEDDLKSHAIKNKSVLEKEELNIKGEDLLREVYLVKKNLESIQNSIGNFIDKKEKKILEIRVFYDDGTYDSFSSLSNKHG